MKESYRKGIANHPDPEPCESGRKVALEALGRGIWCVLKDAFFSRVKVPSG